MANLKEILNEITKKGYAIYCDMDGVLCDFEKGYSKLSKQAFGEPLTFEQAVKLKGERGAWDIIDRAGSKFWSELEWMPNGKALWNTIKEYEPTILSAPSQHPSSTEGKKQWIGMHLGSPKQIFVPAMKKQNYAGKTNILIDDFGRNIKQWVERGGIGIKHKDSEIQQTLTKLQDYL